MPHQANMLDVEENGIPDSSPQAKASRYSSLKQKLVGFTSQHERTLRESKSDIEVLQKHQERIIETLNILVADKSSKLSALEEKAQKQEKRIADLEKANKQQQDTNAAQEAQIKCLEQAVSQLKDQVAQILSMGLKPKDF